MNKEKSKKKVNVDTIMDRIVKLLATVACLTIAGIIVIATLPINVLLKATCIEAAFIVVAIETIVLMLVVIVAIHVISNETVKDLQEMEHSFSDFIDHLNDCLEKLNFTVQNL